MIMHKYNLRILCRGNFRCALSRLVPIFFDACRVMLLCALPLSASALTDPTKPAIDLGASPAVIAYTARLSTVIISPGRRAAIIDGQTVELGAKHGDVRLIEVSESGVVLQGELGRQVLTLFPGVNMRKKMIEPPTESVVQQPAEKRSVGQTLKKRVKVTQHKRVDKPASQVGKKEE
jgi:MSHA biogenesis protein MshK